MGFRVDQHHVYVVASARYDSGQIVQKPGTILRQHFHQCGVVHRLIAQPNLRLKQRSNGKRKPPRYRNQILDWQNVYQLAGPERSGAQVVRPRQRDLQETYSRRAARVLVHNRNRTFLY